MPNGAMMPRIRSFGTATGIPGGSFTTPVGSFHCPVCSYSGPVWHTGPSPAPAFGGWNPMSVLWTTFGGMGGLRTHGAAYSPEFIATGLPTDEEITEMVYDAFDIDPLIPYDADIDVDVDAGVVTLSGTVPNKHAKHAAGDDAWWIPGVTDLRNNITVSPRRRARTAPKE